MKKQFSLEHLYSFVLFAYYEFREFETATQQNITVSQLRTILRRLETDLEVSLFLHRPKGSPFGPGIDWRRPRLTRAGKRLLSDILPFMAQLDQLAAAVQNEDRMNTPFS